MNIDLKGKTALVTGSTSGIGHAIVKGLAVAGANVVVNGRTQGKVDTAVAAVAKAAPGSKIAGVAADVSTAAGCDALEPALDGESSRVRAFDDPAHLEGFQPPASPHREVQTLNRSSVRREGARYRRAYLSPPERALVLCVDEKSQIQALDRSQPLLPMRPGQVEQRTHDL